MKDKLKSFFLNHGEKFGFGLIIVMALYVLWSTRWSPYDRNPQELSRLAKEADQKITNSSWPAEEKQALIPQKDIIARADAMQNGINETKFSRYYAFTTETFTPIYPRSEPIEPPKFFTAEHMLAKADTFLMQTAPEPEDSLLAEGETAEGEAAPSEEVDSNIPEGLRQRPDSRRTEDCGAGIGFESCDDLSLYELPDDCSESLGGDYMMEGGEAETVSLTGEGYRFVSIRGVIDWAAQKRAYAKALHLPPSEAVHAEPEIYDFAIQRQQLLSTEEGWGPWVDLDIENSVDVLMEAYDFEADVVDVSVTNPVITEPLPRRVLGIWKSHATHPRITNFELSPEEQRLEQKRQQKLLEAYEAYKQATQQTETQRPRGFSAYMEDIRSIQNEMNMEGSDYMSDYESDYMEDMRESGGGAGFNRNPRAPQPGGLTESIRQDQTAAGRLLLFRYFDFDVDPGAVYRYRVQIEYVNPNFGKPIELLADRALAEGQTRKSDWSEPTPAVQVRPEAEFYLKDIEYERSTRTDVAALDVYKWNPDTGTVVNDLKRYAVGDEIGGLIETRVVNPLDESFEPQKIKLNTNNVVIDLQDQEDFNIGGNLPDLDKVPGNVRYDELLVMNSHGNLRTYDRFTRESERVKASRFQKFQDDIGKEYQEKAAEAMSAEDLLYEGECGGDYMSEDTNRRPSSAAARRRARRRGLAPRRSAGGEGGGDCS